MDERAANISRSQNMEWASQENESRYHQDELDSVIRFDQSNEHIPHFGAGTNSPSQSRASFPNQGNQNLVHNHHQQSSLMVSGKSSFYGNPLYQDGGSQVKTPNKSRTQSPINSMASSMLSVSENAGGSLTRANVTPAVNRETKSIRSNDLLKGGAKQQFTNFQETLFELSNDII